MDVLGNKFAYIATYGCQMNSSDSERYAGQLEALGYRLTEEMDVADVIFAQYLLRAGNGGRKNVGQDWGIKTL